MSHYKSSTSSILPYFNYLNEYYKKIYVITITRATQRQEKIKKNLDGLNFEFFYGTDKNHWSINEFIQTGIYDDGLSRQKHRYGKPMSLGEVAAACSHKMVYEDVIKNNHQRVLIFEDDVIPDFSKFQFIPAILEELPEDWEVLYWGYDMKNITHPVFATIKKYIYHVQHALGFLNLSHVMIRNLYPVRNSEHISKSGFHDLIHAYAITQTAAQKLLDWNTPVQYCADTGISYAIMNKLIKSYIAHPAVFNQDLQVNPEKYQSLIKQ